MYFPFLTLREWGKRSAIRPQAIYSEVPYYSKIFPINSKPLSNDTLQEVKTFRAKIGNSKKTNLPKFVDYCLALVPK